LFYRQTLSNDLTNCDLLQEEPVVRVLEEHHAKSLTEVQNLRFELAALTNAIERFKEQADDARREAAALSRTLG
jgi:hypothetical protein